MLKAAKAPNRSCQQEINKLLLKYRATPHSSTGISPADLLLGRNIKTWLPQVILRTNNTQVHLKDTKIKHKMKKFADSKTYVHESPPQVCDAVILKHEGIKRSDLPHDEKLLKINGKKGSMITA